ncbi:MAG: Smr/MutS family protein [Alphaproteobacteria bacterium]
MATGRPPRRPGRPLSDEEASLWAAVMRDTRVHDPVIRRRGVHRAPPERDDSAEAISAKDSTPPASPSPPAPALRNTAAVPVLGGGTDRRTQVRLRRGQVEIDGRIDLHGMTQNQARPALEAFVDRAVAAGHRCVLVITGKGSVRPGDEPGVMPDRLRGVLREQVPRWLVVPPLARLVVTWQPAARQHGGEGALYLLLRRQK